MNKSSITRSAQGFTLIETLLTLMIMAFLTVMAAQTIQQAFRAKAKLESQIDTVSQVKDALRLMERDINLAFHYIDLEKEISEELKKSQKAPQAVGAGDPGSEPQPPELQNNNNGNGESANPNRIDPTTQFIAKPDQMHFVTMNTVRLMKDSPQADFGEVSYYLSECKNRPDKKFESGQCLFRRTSPVVDRDPTTGGTAVQLLPDVTEFSLKFFSKVQKDWRDDWNSKTDGGDINTKSRYPEAVEINLTVEPPSADPNNEKKKKKVSLQLIVPVHFPNNQETKTDENQASPNQ